MVLGAKDREIALLRSMLADRQPSDQPPEQEEVPAQPRTEAISTQPKPRKGKAPPVEMFSGEDPNIRFDDWLPSLNRAAVWNGWSMEEKIIQLAGHLQEYNFLGEDQHSTYEQAMQALRDRRDPANKVLAGQVFCHTAQQEGESVADFIGRLESVFHIAYGWDKMSLETKEAILFGQLQEGLRMELLRGPAVSGALGYKEGMLVPKE